jgi:hypothetical protein
MELMDQTRLMGPPARAGRHLLGALLLLGVLAALVSLLGLSPARASDEEVPANWEPVLQNINEWITTTVYLGEGKIIYNSGNNNIYDLHILDTATGTSTLLAADMMMSTNASTTTFVASPGEFYFITNDRSALCHYGNSQLTELTTADLEHAGYGIYAVDGSGPDNIYLLMEPSSGSDEPYLLLRYNGSAWSEVDLSGIPGYDVAADTILNVCLLGENSLYLFWLDTSDNFANKLSYYNGSAWSEVDGYSVFPSRVGKYLPTGQMLAVSSDKKLRVFQNGSQVQEIDLSGLQARFLKGESWFASSASYTYLINKGLFRYDGNSIQKVALPSDFAGNINLRGIAVDEQETLYLFSDYYNYSIYKTVEDLVPPAFSEGYPRFDNISSSGFDLQFALNKSGTVYYRVMVRDADPGSEYNSWASAAAGPSVAGVAVSGLSPETEYDVYLIAKDNFGTWQDAPVKLQVTTLDASSDTTPPEFIEDYPRAANFTLTGFDLQVRLNESGKVYYLVVPDGEPITLEEGQSLAEAVYMNAHGSVSVPGLDEYSVAIGGLDDGTSYDVYVVATDTVGNLQLEPVKLDVTTRLIPVFIQGPEIQSVYSNSIVVVAQAQGDRRLVYEYYDDNGDLVLTYDHLRVKCMVLEAGAAAPSKETIFSEGTKFWASYSKSSGGISTLDFYCQITDLQPGHSYDLYFILVYDSGILQQDEPYKMTFTTTQRLDGYIWRKAGQAVPSKVLANIGGAMFLTDNKILDLDSGSETALDYTVIGVWVRSEDDFFYTRQEGSQYLIMHSVADNVCGEQMECQIAGPRYFAGDSGGIYAFGTGLAQFNEADGSWDEITVAGLPAAEFYSGACTPGYLYLGGRLSAEATPILYRYNRNSGAWTDIPLPPNSLGGSGINSFVREIWALGDEDLALIGAEHLPYLYRYQDGDWSVGVRHAYRTEGAKAVNIGQGGYAFIMQINQIGYDETALYLDHTGWRDMDALEEIAFAPAAACTGLDGCVYILGQSQGSYSIYCLSKLAAEDTQPPVITTSASDCTVTHSSYTFTAGAYDEVDGPVVPTVKLGGESGTVLTGTDQGDDSYSYTATLAEGANTIYIKAADESGNTATATYTITYAADTTPPAFDTGYPKTANLTATGLDLLLKLNEPGTACYQVVADGAEPGSDYADWTAVTIPDTEEVSAPISGLAPGTAYNVYIIAKDTAGNMQAAPVRLDVTTAGESPEGFSIERLGEGGFELGSDANVTVRMTNNTGASQQATLIICLYDNTNNSMERYSYVSREVLAGEQLTMSGGFTIPSSGSYSIKAFVWDTFENMESLLKDPLVMEVN